MYIYDRYSFLMVVNVKHDWVIIARKPGSDFLPSKRSDCLILGGRGYILGGGGWLGYILGGGGGGLILGGNGWWWWIFFGWWWVMVGLFWMVVGRVWFILGGGES